MKLSDIAEIRTGQVLSRKQAKGELGIPYKVFTLSSILKDGKINKDLIEDFQSNSMIDEQLLTKEDDVLIRLSAPYTAVYITKEYENILIPSLVAVIRLKSEEYLPEYVKIFLNSKIAKDEIKREASGTVITTVTTKSLKEMFIPCLPLQKQKRLIHFTKAYLDEKDIMEKIMKLKEEEYQFIINKNFKDEKNKVERNS